MAGIAPEARDKAAEVVAEAETEALPLPVHLDSSSSPAVKYGAGRHVSCTVMHGLIQETSAMETGRLMQI